MTWWDFNIFSFRIPWVSLNGGAAFTLTCAQTYANPNSRVSITMNSHKTNHSPAFLPSIGELESTAFPVSSEESNAICTMIININFCWGIYKLVYCAVIEDNLGWTSRNFRLNYVTVSVHSPIVCSYLQHCLPVKADLKYIPSTN